MDNTLILSVKNLYKCFSAQKSPAVNHLSFELHKGQLLGLLGPSGCGKTTLLRLLAGFETPTEGEIYLAGNRVSSPQKVTPPEHRKTGMVFQDYALFPHLTIGSNIAFGLNKKFFSPQQIKERIQEVLYLVGLNDLEKRYPHELSGGQQQRVALARAIAPQPELILLDEPLSNLDIQVRHRLRHEIRRILKQSHTTAIFVTHDQEEALTISDQIAVMCHGKLEQLATPEEIYTQPASRFVAEFVTQANFIPAYRQEGNQWYTEIGQFVVENGLNYAQKADFMVREEEIKLHPDESGKVTIFDRQFLGREYRYCLQTLSGQRFHARTPAFHPLEIGTKVEVSLTTRSPQLFPIYQD